MQENNTSVIETPVIETPANETPANETPANETSPAKAEADKRDKSIKLAVFAAFLLSLLAVVTYQNCSLMSEAEVSFQTISELQQKLELADNELKELKTPWYASISDWWNK